MLGSLRVSTWKGAGGSRVCGLEGKSGLDVALGVVGAWTALEVRAGSQGWRDPQGRDVDRERDSTGWAGSWASQVGPRGRRRASPV